MSEIVPLLTNAPGYMPGKDKLPTVPPNLTITGVEGLESVNNYSVAEYNSFGHTGGNTNTLTQAELDAKIAKAGDAMTGPLILSGDPSAPNGAATKNYVDTQVTTLGSTVDGKLTIITNSVTTQLQDVSSTINNSITNIQTAVDGKIAKAGDAMTGPLVLVADPTADAQAATKHYVDNAVTSAVTDIVINASFPVDGGVF